MQKRGKDLRSVIDPENPKKIVEKAIKTTK